MASPITSCWIALLLATATLPAAAQERAASQPESAEALLHGGEEQRAAGRYPNAEREFRAARERARAEGNREAEVLALSGLGGTLLGGGEPGGAADALDEALELARGLESELLIAVVQNERGNLLARETRHVDALAAYDEAQRLAARADAHELASRAAANGVRAAIEAGEPAARVTPRIDAALEQADALENASVRAGVLIHLGASLRKLAEASGERANFVRAAGLFASATELAGPAGDLHSLSYAQGYLGELYEADGRWPEALELARRALAAADTTQDPAARYRWLWLQGRILRKSGRPEAAFAPYRDAVKTIAQLRQALGPRQGDSGSSLEQSVRPVFEELVDLLLAQAARAGPGRAQALLGEARAALEDLKYAEVQDYFRDACVREQRAIGGLEGTLVIYPVVLPDRLELIAEYEGRLSRHATAVDQTRVRERVSALRRALETRTTREFRAPARDLYDWLFRPVEEALPETARVDTVVYVPGDVLRTIPMGALVDRDGDRFLIEKYPLAVTPGLTLTEPRSMGKGEMQLLAAGITQAVQGFPALASVASELDAARGVFANTAELVDRDYTAASLHARLAERPFGIVHIASHGEFRGDVAESFLLTFDDRLSMDQLAGMLELTQHREQPVELLTLSACSTAAGDERAALGLAGVAVRAGARSALATLWSVNDEAAAQLIGSFYRKLGQGDHSRARALQQAQLELIAEKSLRHPFYWAPFLLINSWL